MKVRVSFILPTRNRPAFVQSTLDAVSKYIGKADELILVDASRDAKTKKVASKYPFVTQYIHVEDRGEAFSVNTGLLQAKGEFIKEVSDDDIIFPEVFKDTIKYLQKNPKIEAIQCGGEASELSRDGKVRLLRFEKLPRQKTIANDFNALMEFVPCGVGLIFRRSILAKVGLFDTSYTAVDTNYMARIILAKCNFKYRDVCLYRHILYPHSAENRDEQIHADRSRSYLLLSMWKEALDLRTIHVAKSLGIGSSLSAQGYLWVVKVLNYIRGNVLGRLFFLITGQMIEFSRNIYLDSMSNEVQIQKPARWSGKSW